MSEVTTGSVALTAITAVPKAIGNACIKAGQYVNQYCKKEHRKMLKNIERCDERLKWHDQQLCNSPREIGLQAKELMNIVSKNPFFEQMTEGIAAQERELLAGVIATQNSPLKTYVSSVLEEIPNQRNFRKVLERSEEDLTKTNFEYVATVLDNMACATGFEFSKQTIKNTAKVRDNVYTDNEGRKLTTFLRLGRDGSPKLAVDLEGFACDTHACTNKMEDIIRYLKSRGISFDPKRIRHNNPLGVLRQYAKEKNIGSRSYFRKKLGHNKENYLNQ